MNSPKAQLLAATTKLLRQVCWFEMEEAGYCQGGGFKKNGDEDNLGVLNFTAWAIIGNLPTGPAVLYSTKMLIQKAACVICLKREVPQ